MKHSLIFRIESHQPRGLHQIIMLMVMVFVNVSSVNIILTVGGKWRFKESIPENQPRML
jgi:hypothetical protein